MHDSTCRGSWLKGAHCLLGRKKSWPAGRWSTLAGFVEVGESVEDTVVREVKEETGLTLQPGSFRLLSLFSDPKRDHRR